MEFAKFQFRIDKITSISVISHYTVICYLESHALHLFSKRLEASNGRCSHDNAKEALGAGMDRPHIPVEFDSSRDDSPDTGIVS
jgi:hypothetical protein